MRFPKHKQNLRREGDKIYSYVTHVATIVDDCVLVVHGYWSRTTSRHISYVAKYLNLRITYNEMGVI